MNIQRSFPRLGLHVVLGVFFCAGAAVAVAAEPDIACPATWQPANLRIVDAPAGWTPFTTVALRLSAIGIMYGPPESRAIAKPDSAEKNKADTVVKWTLSMAAGEQAWVSCSYGKDMALTLSQPLPLELKACTATYKIGKAGVADINFRCK